MRDNLGNPQFSGRPEFSRGILLLDDCEGTCNWVASGTGANYSATYDTAAALTGLKGLKLATRPLTPAADDECVATRLMSYPESGMLVFRCAATSTDLTKVKSIGILLQVKNGTNAYYANLLWSPTTGHVTYLDAAGAEIEIPALETLSESLAFLQIEIVVDALAMQYIEVAFNGRRASLAGIGLYDAGAFPGRDVALQIQVIAVGADPAIAYVDNIYCGEYLNI
jgi:hypothetical protein